MRFILGGIVSSEVYILVAVSGVEVALDESDFG